MDILDFYQRLHETAEATAGPGAVFRSGFDDGDVAAAKEAFSWRPVGALPARIVPPPTYPDGAAFMIDGTCYVGVRAGGGLTEWALQKFRGKQQSLSIVLDGWYAFDLSLTISGSQDWDYIELSELAGNLDGPPEWIEMEKNGRLLFSGPIDSETFARAEGFDVTRPLSGGLLYGWAAHGITPSQGVFFKLRCQPASGPALTKTVFAADDWKDPEKHPNRRAFRFHPGIEDTLVHIAADPSEVRNSARLPVWFFSSAGVAVLLANPVLEDNGLRITVLASGISGEAPLKLLLAEGTVVSAVGEDHKPYRYYMGRNTVCLPLAAASAPVGPTLLDAGGMPLCSLPCLKPIADAAAAG